MFLTFCPALFSAAEGPALRQPAECTSQGVPGGHGLSGFPRPPGWTQVEWPATQGPRAVPKALFGNLHDWLQGKNNYTDIYIYVYIYIWYIMIIWYIQMKHGYNCLPHGAAGMIWFPMEIPCQSRCQWSSGPLSTCPGAFEKTSKSERWRWRGIGRSTVMGCNGLCYHVLPG